MASKFTGTGLKFIEDHYLHAANVVSADVIEGKWLLSLQVY